MVDWKKEIKLGELVGRKTEPGENVATVAPGDEAPGDDKSFWKREIRLRKPSEEGGKPSRTTFVARSRSASSARETAPSRFARPGAPKPEPQESDKRRSRFARPGVKQESEPGKQRSRFGRSKPAGDAQAEAPARRPSRFARVTKPASGQGTDAPARGLFRSLFGSGASRTERAPGERRIRFTRPGSDKAGAGDVVTEPRARGRSPLAREISFRRRAKSESAGKQRTSGRSSRSKKTEIVGLKVGASHLSAAHVVTNGHAEVVQVARESIERGVVVGGELRDPAALGVALGEFFRRHKLPQKAVRLGIGTNRIGVRRLEIAGLQHPSHLENAIRFRAQEVLPIPLEEAVLDYQVVGETTDEKGNTVYRVLLVVAYRDLIQRYVQACRAAGLKLVGIDLEAFGLLRALAPEGTGSRDDAAVVIVSIGHDRSTFVVADGTTCEFARVLDWGGGALDVAIARALDRTPSQVHEVKHSLTLNATQERLDGYSPEQVTAVYENVRKELQTFVRELVSSLHFYQNQPGSLGIGEITITGGTAQLPGLAAELQRLIGVSVRVADPFSRVTSSKRIGSDVELGSLAVAIGLGIEG